MARPKLFPKAPKGERIRSVQQPHDTDLPVCERCGRHVKNPTRRHQSPDGYSCNGVRPVSLDALPEVEMPKRRGQTPRQRVAKAASPGRMARGECHTCGKRVTGERWYCGQCARKR